MTTTISTEGFDTEDNSFVEGSEDPRTKKKKKKTMGYTMMLVRR